MTRTERIEAKEALELFQSNKVLEIGQRANAIRSEYNSTKAYYIINGHINYSNICEIRCSFCSFRRSAGQRGSYTMNIEEILKKLEGFNSKKLQELHIVGGLHPELPFTYYKELLKAIKTKHPHITLKAFTAVEIAHFGKQYSMRIERVFEELIESGLGTIPGGGAEILTERIRKKICPTKITGEEWLNIHRIAHKMGLKTNATMLFGHIESYEDRIEHLERIRELQDETAGFQSFIPLTYHPDNNPLRSKRTSSLDELKTLAISRIYLDNIPHIKAYWVMMGVKLAQIALNFGADDLDGTIQEEKIYHEAGAKTPQSLTIGELQRLIKEAEKEPIERTSFYEAVQDDAQESPRS